MTQTTIKPEHACGLCDSPIQFAGFDGNHPTFRCTSCDWWHTARMCCCGFENETV